MTAPAAVGADVAVERSLVERLALLTPAQRAEAVATLRPRDAATLLYAWPLFARPSQLAPPGDWSVLLFLAGRGWGKSRSGAEWVRARVDAGHARSVALIGPSLGDIRDTMLGEGREERGAGLLSVWPPSQRPKWEASKRRVTFWNGAIATIYSAEEPELRGPNLDTVWADELAKWRYLAQLWANLEMAMRRPGPTSPRVCVTTTPRPLDLLRELVADPHVKVVRGSTFENAANLDPVFIERMRARYAGTRLGAQELYAEILNDNPDALFRQAEIDRMRVDAAPAQLAQIVVSVDPAVSTGRSSDETGIIVAGAGDAGRLYVLEDLSGRYLPEQWAGLVVRAVQAWSSRSAGAVLVVAETNRGGDLVQATLRARSASLPIALVRASQGKELRAEPVSTLYARSRVAHVGRFAELELQMTEWSAREGRTSPDRLDALVWAMWQLAHLDRIDHTQGGSAQHLPGAGSSRLDPLAEPRGGADAAEGWFDGGGRFL